MIDASFILLLCFVGFTAIAFKFGYKKSIAGLDEQISNVSKTVESALQFLKQAQEKHDQEVQYETVIEHEIAEIFKRNQHQIEEIQHQAKAELDRTMKNRIIQADARLDRLRSEIMDELTLHVTNQVVQTLDSLFTAHLSSKMQKKINDHFIDELDQLFQKDTTINTNTSSQKKIVNGS